MNSHNFYFIIYEEFEYTKGVASDLREVGGFLRVSSSTNKTDRHDIAEILLKVTTNKTDRHDITEILLKVALNTISLNQTKEVIRIHKSKDRHHNCQKKKNKRTINDLQNITHKTKDRVARTPLKQE